MFPQITRMSSENSLVIRRTEGEKGSIFFFWVYAFSFLTTHYRLPYTVDRLTHISTIQ